MREASNSIAAGTLPASRTSAGLVGQIRREVDLEDLFRAEARSGRFTLIFRSIRPGRRIAGSMRSARLEARMITTSLRDSMPSISVQNIGTSVERIFENRVARRVPRIDSRLHR